MGSQHRAREAEKHRLARKLRHRTKRRALATKRRRLDIHGPGLELEFKTVVEEGQRKTVIEVKQSVGEKFRGYVSRFFGRRKAA